MLKWQCCRARAFTCVFWPPETRLLPADIDKIRRGAKQRTQPKGAVAQHPQLSHQLSSPCTAFDTAAQDPSTKAVVLA